MKCKKIFSKKYQFLIVSVVVAFCLFNFTFAQTESEIAQNQEETEENSITIDVDSFEGYEKLAENERFELYVDGSEAFLYLHDKISGQKLFSNPPDREEDSRAQGVDRMSLASQLEIEYFDEATMNTSKSTSYAASIRRGAFEIKKINNGVRIIYTFEREEIVIPVDYTLSADKFNCVVNIDEIEEIGTNKVLSINILPFFGAANLNREGFILVPDGSGSLINFNNGKIRAEAYGQDIYGRDESIKRALRRTVTYRANMPVVGLSSDEGGFFAIMTKGEALGRIRAEVSGMRTSYNSAGFSFRVRGKDLFVLGEELYFSREIDMIQLGKTSTSKVEIAFFPLESGKNSYVDMADIYRKHLEDKYDFKKSDQTDPSIHLEFWGGMIKTKPVLGLPAEVFVPLNTYGDVLQIAQELNNSEISNIVFSYINWNLSDTKGKLFSSRTPSLMLGGKRSLNELTDYADKIGFKIYLESDLLKFSSETGVINRFFRSAKQISGFPADIFSYKINTYNKDLSKTSYFLLKPKFIDDIGAKLIKSFSKTHADGYGIGDGANLVYSDFSRNTVDANSIVENVNLVYEQMKNNGLVIYSSAANEYAFANSSFVGMTPANTSWQDIVDSRIPFYQIVLSGYLPFSIEPVNLNGNLTDNLLRAIETGGSASYVLVNRNYSEIKESSYNFLFGCDYDLWKDDIIASAKIMSAVSDLTAGTSIIKHKEIMSGVFATLFESGGATIVNYNSHIVEVNGLIIDARSYALIENGGGIFNE